MAFLRALGLNKAANIYQPKPRVAPYSSAVKGQCVTFAGRTDDFLKSKEELSSTVEVFDQYLEQWRALKTTGSLPKGLYSGGCCSTPNGDLYVYGGRDGPGFRGGLYKLVMNCQELEWRQLSAESDPNGPMRKAGCRMVCLQNKKLTVIGGCGIPHGPPQPGSMFIKDAYEGYTDGRGFTNEIHFYDIEECPFPAREQEREYTVKEAERRREEAEKRVEEVAQAAREWGKKLQRVIETGDRGKEQAVLERKVAQRREREAREETHRERESAMRERERERVQLNQRRAEEAEGEARELGTQWVVQRREIQLTNVELGRGGWGAVTVANFRGIQVASKCLYKDLASEYYQDMFSREMNMAACLRHPNLVQFIGASIEGLPIILTELMKTSLRAELEKNNIKQPQVKCISMDVARALNYLHLMQPHPIIHRDISSANVLLDPLPENQWKAKVSDYGSVNLQQQLHTENPGSPVYSAPEANTPAFQSPKMDIFSVGVLLVEMLSGRFPQVSSRQRLIASIDHAGYLTLIQQCLKEDRDQRPSAQQLLTALSQI